MSILAVSLGVQTQDSILSHVEDPGPWSVTSSPKLQSVFFFITLVSGLLSPPKFLELLLFGLEWGGGNRFLV